MNPTSSTLKFVGVAALSALLAFGAWRGSQPSQVDGYGDVGQDFFPDFDDVAKASALTVVDYDGDEKDVVSFSVKQNNDGLWVIPSHHDYPAEAADRLARTATSLLGVKKTAVKSRSKDDWKRFGVVDPAEDGAATADERGTRLTLSDGSGNPMVDLIIGSKVEGQEKQFHVREPEKNTTYIAELDVDLSAKFSDWIEPDLLKITSSDLVKITLDNYSVNEERGTVEKKELLEFKKADLKSTGDWQLADLDAAKEELDKSPITSIATNLDQLKIVGVRPKPEGLDDNMRINPVVKQLLQSQMQALGYFIGGDKDGNERLYSNEGELIAGTDKGVEYTLYFGEIARGSGKDIEVGLKGDAKSDDASAEESTDEAAEEDGPRRYLLVKVGYNEELLGKKPVAPIEPQKPAILQETEADPESKEAAKTDAEAASEETPKADDGDACGADEPDAASEEVTEPADEPAEPASEQTTDEVKSEDAAQETTPETPAKAEDVNEAKEDETPAEEKPAGDEAATQKPAEEEAQEEKPEEPKADPKKVAQQEYDAAMAAYKSEKSAYDSDLKAFEEKAKEGKEKADELALRFSGWYYVISSDSFEKFRIERKDVVSKKEEKKADDKDAAKADGDE